MSKKREELLLGLEEENRKSTAESMFLLQAVAERSGMNLTDLQCITILTSTGPITAGRLAEEMGFTTGSVTRVIDRMERAGYVRREKDPDDGRRVIVRPVSEKLERTGAGFFASMDLYRKSKWQTVTVTFRYPRRFGGLFEWRSRSGGEVTLNAAVPWEVELRGGAYKVEADLSGLKLTSFVLTRGSSDVDLTLPEPSGMVPVRLSGGASKVNIRRPAGVEAHLSVKGGASKLTFDEQNFDAVGGKLRLQSSGYDSASDHCEIEVSGGASKVTVQ
jgi:DNA-binding MarR family transcriptional regulator